jgi:hypothetical protein
MSTPAPCAALGAYGFLSTAKGKKYFLKYIPEGLRLLKEDLSVAENAFPVLYDIVKDLQETLLRTVVTE